MHAVQKLKAADHMLTNTYPLVEDPKVLLAVLENVQQSIDHAIRDKLLRARQEKKIPLYSDTLQGRYAAFQKHFKIGATTKKHLQEIYDTMEEHKKSPMEFRRGKAFIICDDDYKTKRLTEANLREYIETAKRLL